MQNRYIGDLGDFGKYGLLRALVSGAQVSGAQVSGAQVSGALVSGAQV